jgi:hypothetical protein
MKRRRDGASLVVVDESAIRRLQKSGPGIEKLVTGAKSPSANSWIVNARKDPLDFCIYKLFYQLGGINCCIVVDDDCLHVLSATLKQLGIEIIAVSSQMTAKQVKSNFTSKAIQNTIIGKSALGALKEVAGKKSFSAIIHAFSYDRSCASLLHNLFTNAQHFIFNQDTSRAHASTGIPPFPSRDDNISKLRSRVSLARQICEFATGQNCPEEGRARALANMRNQLKVLLAEDVNCALWDPAQKKLVIRARPQPRAVGENPDTTLKKMILLGMLHVAGKAQADLHVKADAGRTLAVSRWMDGVPGGSVGCPWAAERLGASVDSVSREAVELVSAMKDYAARKRAGRRSIAGAQGELCFQTPAGARHVLPPRVLSALRCCRVVAFDWRPNAAGEGDWGGKYGKACGHNEVAMFYARPFAPIEVLNTHLCSRASPAPGNSGFDGCLEFLVCQCKWFCRPYSLWDDKYFYSIDVEGTVTQYPKSKLMACDLNTVGCLMDQLRWMIVQGGYAGRPVSDVLRIIRDYLRAIRALRRDFSQRKALLGDNIIDTIMSFVLVGDTKAWKEVNLDGEDIF